MLSQWGRKRGNYRAEEGGLFPGFLPAHKFPVAVLPYWSSEMKTPASCHKAQGKYGYSSYHSFLWFLKTILFPSSFIGSSDNGSILLLASRYFTISLVHINHLCDCQDPQRNRGRMGFAFRRFNGTKISALSTEPHCIHIHSMLYYRVPYMLYTPFTLPSFIVIPFCNLYSLLLPIQLTYNSKDCTQFSFSL